jgi:hypothetical protein
VIQTRDVTFDFFDRFPDILDQERYRPMGHRPVPL